MEIVRIERKQKTEKYDYTLITFKKWYGKEFSEICITPNDNISTIYAKNGLRIHIPLWEVVKSFLETDEKIHNYKKK